jgi:hypothetical protein
LSNEETIFNDYGLTYLVDFIKVEAIDLLCPIFLLNKFELIDYLFLPDYFNFSLVSRTLIGAIS